ncbi:MAG: ComEC/Rec2 family competence protein [Bacteroidota bacterium]|nr:ComEC/Rec2 family competence protein [Bacteroidota bacterium]
MFSWHSIPFARYLLAFVLGIFIAIYVTQISFEILVPIVLLGFGAILIFSKTSILKKHKFKSVLGLLVLGLLVILGVFRTKLYQQTNLPHYFKKIEKAQFYQVEIKRSVVEKAKFFRAYAEVVNVIDSQGKSHKSSGKILLYLSKTLAIKQPRIGNQYIILAESNDIPPPANPGEFNYKQFLSYQNIHHQTFVHNEVIELNAYTYSVFRFAEQLRDEVRLILKNAFKNKEVLGVAEALLIGYKDDLDQEVVAAFSRTGTLHVLAVSGLHAGIIYWILGFLTGFLKKVPRGVIIQTIIIVLSLWLYAFITGLSSSVMRSALMFSVVGLSKLFNRRTNIFNTIYVSAFIILVINPLDIVNVSFQLSYAALLGIVFVQPMINNWYAPYNKIDKFIWGLISVSFAAQLFTFPLGVYYFHQFPNYFLFSNLIIIPIIIVLLVLLILTVSFSWIPIVFEFLTFLSQGLIQINNYLVKWLDQLPGSHINGLHLDFWQLAFIYLSLFLFLLIFSTKLKIVFFSFLSVILILLLSFSYQNIIHQKQKILTFHDIKRHDVYTCMEGKKVYIISDSIFLSKKSAIRFHLEPYFWEHGIQEILTCDFSKNHAFANLKIKKDLGFQFFDRKMTMYNNGISESDSIDFLVVKWQPMMEILNLKNKRNILFISNLKYNPNINDSFLHNLGFTNKYYSIKLH